MDERSRNQGEPSIVDRSESSTSPSSIYIGKNNQRLGPYELRYVQAEVDAGRIVSTDLAWHEGASNWFPVAQLSGIRLPNTKAAAFPPLPAQPQTSWPGAKYCQHCGERIHDRAEICPKCGVRQPMKRTQWSRRETIQFGLLLSAIFNFIFAALWMITVVGIVLTVPLVILACFELRLRSQADGMPDALFVSQAKTVAVFEIIVGVLGNILSVSMGVSNLMQAREMSHGR